MKANPQLEPLANSLMQLTPAPEHPAFRHLFEALKNRYKDCVVSILFYGSCLRSGDPYDGLVDLYLIVDNYRCANSSTTRAFWNWLLPPNVFYIEFPHQGKIIRCKYAKITLDDFNKGTSPRWFHSYLWGRFSQPTAIAWSRDRETQNSVASCMAQAIVTFLNRALPGIPASGSAQSLWQDALKLSYGTELRPEPHTRTQQLTTNNSDYYHTVTELAAPLLNGNFSFTPGSGYTFKMDKQRRMLNRMGWRLRSLQGKVLSVARLSKALLTFEGALDYLIWKLERHSGQQIDVPDKVRRHPFLFAWSFVWRLYRRGIFR